MKKVNIQYYEKKAGIKKQKGQKSANDVRDITAGTVFERNAWEWESQQVHKYSLLHHVLLSLTVQI
jgi:hypothetical protein